MARVTITWNEAALRNLLQGPDGAVVRHIRGLTVRTEAVAKTLCPVDNGLLRASIDSDVDAGPGTVTGTVFTPLDYGLWVHEGTGVYGPVGRPIRPTRGRYLVFRGRDGEWVFAREVRGMRGRPFLTDALRAVSPYPVVDVAHD